ncbi:hypothetical protein [Serratia marcescens]|uniref:hypothetical protein n=1 Tax=Serratia marcescens TaxID=615 RepID=UPI003FA7281D
MIKRIGSLLAVVALTASLSACCWGPHWGGGHLAMALAIITAVIEAKTMPLTK